MIVCLRTLPIPRIVMQHFYTSHSSMICQIIWEHFNLIRFQMILNLKGREREAKNCNKDVIRLCLVPNFFPAFQLQFPFKFPFISASSSTSFDMNASLHSLLRLFQSPLPVSLFVTCCAERRRFCIKRFPLLASIFSDLLYFSSIFFSVVASCGASAYLYCFVHFSQQISTACKRKRRFSPYPRNQEQIYCVT